MSADGQSAPTLRHRVAILGGGFGGLAAARRLAGAEVDVVLIDRHNYHLFQPLLYQVATGALSPANIATPLRGILAGQSNARVLLGDVVRLDLDGRCLILSDGEEVPYDSLVVAAGSRYDYFGHEEWSDHAPALKSLDDAIEIRRRVLSAFEEADREDDAARRSALLTFVVVGGGPTGVELAGALGELARDSLRHEYRGLAPSEVRILLVEAEDGVLAGYPQSLRRKALRSLERLGVTVRLRTLVTGIRDGQVLLRPASEPGAEPALVEAATVLWAAGVRATSLASSFAEAGVATDRAGRVEVAPDLSLPGHPEVYVVGDLAHVKAAGGRPLPAIAPVAIQEGEYAARRILDRPADRPTPHFRYRDKGKMATIGRGHAVAQLGWLHVSGFVGWLLWLWVHLWQLATFQNRALVLTQWAWFYVTHNRSARLIGSPHRVPPEG